MIRKQSARQRFRFRPYSALLTTAVWIVLWGSISPLTVFSGLLLSWFISIAFPLPPIYWTGKISVVGVLTLSFHLIKDLIISSLRMVRLALDPRLRLNAGLVRIDLHTDNDLYQVITAEVISLVPGTVVVEVVRHPRRLYLHAIDLVGPDSVAKVQRNAEQVEARVIRAFGSAVEQQKFADSLHARPITATPTLEDEES